MKHRGVSFSDEMMVAILDGRKTQTRRGRGLKEINEEPEMWEFLGWLTVTQGVYTTDSTSEDYMVDNCGCLVAVFENINNGDTRLIPCPYGATGDTMYTWVPICVICQPRKYARATSPIVRIGVERLGDITLTDALEEGTPLNGIDARLNFIDLWERVYGKEAWERDKRTWRWVVEFEEVTT